MIKSDWPGSTMFASKMGILEQRVYSLKHLIHFRPVFHLRINQVIGFY